MKVTIRQPKQSRNSGFTLVEMLVSVTLILLMMTMFASIFQLATDSLSTHRAISERDQKVRQLTTLIRSDFQKRTQRYPLPFYPGEDLDLGPKSPDLRQGYFYLSTNDPASNYDTVLQFTVRSTIEAENADTTEYFGSARELLDQADGVTAPFNANLYQNPNQPEVDDGGLQADFATSSPAAQVAYFIRNGNLYRRVILIRNPQRIAGGELQAQPTSSVANNLFLGEDSTDTYVAGFQLTDGLSNDFHRYFDFSAIADTTGDQFASFLGTEALSNQLTASGAANESLGNPVYRWGFDQFTGLSREHASAASRIFTGRLLHAETSAFNFNWPMTPMVVETSTEADAATIAADVQGDGNPYSLTGTPLTYSPGNDLITELDGTTTGIGRGGERRMEDLVLANVQEFIVELWDDRANRFVNPGYGSINDADAVVGDFHIRRNLNYDSADSRFNYGPLAPYDETATREVDRQPHVFDTWHPNVTETVSGGLGELDLDGDGTVEMSEIQAPYTPYFIYPPRQNDTPGGPCSPIAPPSSLSALSPLTLRGFWADNTDYDVGDVVFATYGDLNTNGSLDWRSDDVPAQAFQTAYRCIVAGTSDAAEPSWPVTPGKRISDNDVVWESFDNRRPLRAIRITLRFLNSNTGEPQQLSLVLAMTNGV